MPKRFSTFFLSLFFCRSLNFPSRRPKNEREGRGKTWGFQKEKRGNCRKFDLFRLSPNLSWPGENSIWKNGWNGKTEVKEEAVWEIWEAIRGNGKPHYAHMQSITGREGNRWEEPGKWQEWKKVGGEREEENILYLPSMCFSFLTEQTTVELTCCRRAEEEQEGKLDSFTSISATDCEGYIFWVKYPAALWLTFDFLAEIL